MQKMIRPTLDRSQIIEPAVHPHRKAHAAVLLSAALVSIVGIAAFAQSQAKTGPTGKAQVVERRGPELPIAANAGGQVVVLFPTASGQQGGQQGDEVEVVFVESNVPAAQEGQPAQQPSQTGREIVFSTRDANEGIVRYAFEPNGGARKVMILARVAGKYVEARQTGGGEGVTVFTVTQPVEQKQDATPAAQPAQPAADQGGQGGQAGGQPAAEGGQPPAAATPAAAPAAPVTPPPPTQAAVIMVYTGGTGR